jgi:hypothetical protein
MALDHSSDHSFDILPFINLCQPSYDPLTLYRLIERTVLAQTEDRYPFSTVYDQELSFYSFKQ